MGFPGGGVVVVVVMVVVWLQCGTTIHRCGVVGGVGGWGGEKEVVCRSCLTQERN